MVGDVVVSDSERYCLLLTFYGCTVYISSLYGRYGCLDDMGKVLWSMGDVVTRMLQVREMVRY